VLPNPNDYSNHAWNEVYANGSWIIMDTTWDSGNEREDGAVKKSGGLSSYRYFDTTISTFSQDHMAMSYK
jgi:transglutaminase/protease-like cytokinesis protein 3